MTLRQRVKAFTKLTRIEEYYGTCFIVAALGIIGNNTVDVFDRGLLFIALLSLNCFAFAVNDIEDAEDDFHDPKKRFRNPISAGLITPKTAYTVSAVLFLICLVIFTSFGITSLIFGLIALVLAFLYSYKKIRLKSVPILDLVSHGLFLGALQSLIVASAMNHKLTPLEIFIALLIFTASVLGDINNEIRDYEVDRKTKIRNTASIIDVTKIASFTHFIVMAPFIGLGLIILFKTPPYTITLLFIACIIFGLYYISKYLRHRKRGFYDRFAQVITTVAGLIMLSTI